MTIHSISRDDAETLIRAAFLLTVAGVYCYFTIDEMQIAAQIILTLLFG